MLHDTISAAARNVINLLYDLAQSQGTSEGYMYT